MDYTSDESKGKIVKGEEAERIKMELNQLIRKANICYDKLCKHEYMGIEEGTGLFVTGMVAIHEAKKILKILGGGEKKERALLHIRSSLNKLFFPTGHRLDSYRAGELRMGQHVRFR